MANVKVDQRQCFYPAKAYRGKIQVLQRSVPSGSDNAFNSFINPFEREGDVAQIRIPTLLERFKKMFPLLDNDVRSPA